MSRRPKLDNQKLIPFVVYDLGGAGKFIDVEEIFYRCWELAPERFNWRTRPLPNYKALSQALRDLEGSTPGLFVKTPDGLSRQLSAEGIEWVRERLPEFRELLGQPSASPPTRRPAQRMLNSLRDGAAVQAFLRGDKPELTKHELADLLMCSPDSPPEVWRERLETFRSAAEGAKRQDLRDFLEYARSSRPEWFEGRK